MNKLYSNIIFSILITLVMNGLDIAYHLATDWAVHLNYVAIKLTLIFLTVFLIAQFIGKGKEEGIVTSISGPFIFYIYYLFANPTINRELFRVDEQFWFFFMHSFFMLIAYFSALKLVKAEEWLKKISFVILASFASLALDAIFIISRFKLQGIGEEEAAALMTFNLITPSILAFVIASLISLIFFKKRYSGLIFGLIAAIVIFLFSSDLIHAVSAFIISNIIYYFIITYKLENYSNPKINKVLWLILGIISLGLGSFYEFVPRKTIKLISEFLIFDITIFNYRIRQNDIILIATILIIIGLVSFYKVYKLNKNSK